MRTYDAVKYYRNAPQDLTEEFFTFRRDHPYQTITHAGLDWRYQVDGKGRQSLFFAPGGMQVGEGWFKYFNHFKDRFRLIALTYPDGVKQMAPIVEAIRLIIDKEKVAKLTLIGSSLGGLVVQAFLHTHPQLVTQAIIADTAAPNERWGLRMRGAIRLLKWFPMFLLTRTALKRLDEYVNSTEEPARSFWRAYMIEHYKRLTSKAWLINHRAVIADFCESVTYSPADLAKWTGKALIVESESDLFGTSMQKELRSLYPMAKVYRFKGDAGHSPAITREKQYIRMMETFLGG